MKKLAIIMSTLCAGYACAAPVIDGKFDPLEGYTGGVFLYLNVENAGYADDPGELWIYQDAANSDIYAALILPVTLVDNSYGDNSIGWGDDAASGKHHNFRDLLGSDGAEFNLFNNYGESVLHFELDYFSEDKGSYFSEIVDAEKGGSEGSGDTSMVKAWATSLEYNFNMLDLVLTEDSPEADSAYNVADPAQSGWIFKIVYEVKIDGDIFGNDEFGWLDIPIVHASPNKIGRNKAYPEPGGEVPEPMTLLLLGLGSLIIRRFK